MERGEVGPLKLPNLIFGTATFMNLYNREALLQSGTPLRTVGLALRYVSLAKKYSPEG